ncbi:MAG: NAD(P)H-hydrate dehydratase [Armatimonadetes bacterium]|nr:NAD(P)H-hydrate dehydratase [Armatimonadota bacterium]
MYILSREEMYFLDKYTIEKIGIPGKELMEKAGKGCAEFIINELLSYPGNMEETLKGSSEKNLEKETFSRFNVAVFCGSGNNGGDGFVIARYLKNWKYFPKVFLLGSTEKMSPETFENYESCEELQIEIVSVENTEELNDLSEFDLIVDAIFGVGLQGAVRGWRADIIDKINNSGKLVVAIDIASGVNANTGQAEVAVNADFTLTMAAYKYGHYIEKGREKSGIVKVIDIGISDELYEKFPPKTKLITDQNVKYPKRFPLSHKGHYGRVGIIAGSPGFSGAAIMACRAALRSGAGLITLFHPKEMDLIFETQLLEVMTYSIIEGFDEFFKKLNTMDVLLIGPGMGTTLKAKELINFVLQNWEKPAILDADALNLLSENKDILKLVMDKPFILTPHIGEFARLSHKSIPEILADPLKALERFTQKYKCCVLLKSATTIFADGKEFIFDISGNDGLSTGGSGDVLAGIIVSFLGQKLSLKDAAISASFLMGKTAEKLAKNRKPASIIPLDIIDDIFKY